MPHPAHYGALPHIFIRAKKLRLNMTPEEKLLWNYLSSNKLGFRFKRQHPIDHYIADFYCHKAKLVMEIDGNGHEEQEQKRKDAKRTARMEELGLHVIRFKNHEVLEYTEKVVGLIKETMHRRIEALAP